MIRKRKVVGAVAAVTLAMVLAACGSSTGGTKRPAGPASQGPTPTGDPVKIGLQYSEVPGFQQFAASKQVADAWTQWVNNEMGGVNGHPVEIIAINDQLNGDTSVASARQLVEQDHVAAVISQTPLSYSVNASYFASQKMPLIGGIASDIDVTKAGSNVYPMEGTTPYAQAAPVLAISQSGGRSYAVAACAEVPSCTTSADIMAKFAPAGVTSRSTVRVGTADASYTGPCLGLVQGAPDAIVLVLGGAVSQKLVPECQLQGFTGSYVVQANSADKANIDALTGAGASVIGTQSNFPWWADAEPAQRFRDVIDRYAPDTPMGSTATGTWSTLELFRKAMKAHGPGADKAVDAAAVRDAYAQIKDETLDGLLPQPLTFGANTPSDVTCVWPFTVENRKPKTLAPHGDSGNGQTGDLASSCLHAN
ncbi:ABC transporter substrate-binding protein [Granulicoccus phenolivorans]|uniref:ABC transporter substrate-binding protein n=1 Tax=Granulicoccus phenolivorans TaxID=266854 RepID=UPI00047D5887|nr:ABC transporter substrate-binding protein [Granulicoccus phenolivorans]